MKAQLILGQLFERAHLRRNLPYSDASTMGTRGQIVLVNKHKFAILRT